MVLGRPLGGQVAGLQIRPQRRARHRRIVQRNGELGANRLRRVARAHPRPIDALRQQIVAVLVAYLRDVLVARARLDLQQTGDRLPRIRCAPIDVLDGQIEPGQAQRLIAAPHLQTGLSRVVGVCVAAAEQLGRAIVEVGAEREAVAAKFTGLVNCLDGIDGRIWF